MTVVVPEELQERINRVLRTWHRGLASDHEATNEVHSLIHSFAAQERPPGEVDAWDERAVGARFNELFIEVASSMDVPVEVLARAMGIATPGADARLDRKAWGALSTRSPGTGLGEGEFQLAVTWLGHGRPASTNLMTLIAESEPLSGESFLRYLVARNDSDRDTCDSLVAADVAAGCPTSLIRHLDRARAPRTDVEMALSAVDKDLLQRESRWGDIAEVAVFLAENGWIAAAHEWSIAVKDERVPLIADRVNLADQPPHHQYLGRVCMWSFDSRVFAPLALIDLLAGDEDRARARAVTFHRAEDAFEGPESWALAGHFALAQWVSAHTTDSLERRKEFLEAIQARHTWLGLLQAQINADLAVLAALEGDRPAEERLRREAESALKTPSVDLHFGAFPYDKLLRQLPVRNAHVSGSTEAVAGQPSATTIPRELDQDHLEPHSG